MSKIEHIMEQGHENIVKIHEYMIVSAAQLQRTIPTRF